MLPPLVTAWPRHYCYSHVSGTAMCPVVECYPLGNYTTVISWSRHPACVRPWATIQYDFTTLDDGRGRLHDPGRRLKEGRRMEWAVRFKVQHLTLSHRVSWWGSNPRLSNCRTLGRASPVRQRWELAPPCWTTFQHLILREEKINQNPYPYVEVLVRLVSVLQHDHDPGGFSTGDITHNMSSATTNEDAKDKKESNSTRKRRKCL